MQITNRHLLRTGLLMALTALVVLLSSCAGHERTEPDRLTLDSNDRQTQVNNLKHWKILGKLGIRTPDQAASATLNWSQNNDYFDIYLTGPLGQGSTRIEGANGNVSLHRNGQSTVQAETPEELFYNTVGWQLPISDLKYWVRGIAAPNSPTDQIELNEDDTIALLVQHGWTVDYNRYQTEQRLLLPARLIISRDKIKLTLIIKNWQLTL